MPNLELNGRVPDVVDTLRLVTTNYGHFTTMQVRNGKVRGLALHMARLDEGMEAFFGHRMGVPDAHRVRELMRHALGDSRDASVRVRLVPGPEEQGLPDVVVAVSEPATDVRPPLRVRTVVYERDWPEQKHAATMALHYAKRSAQAVGYNDALFLGSDGRVREGTTWNVAFWDGEKVVWPQAPMLKGVTMVLLQAAMTMTGTPWIQRPISAGELPDLMAGAAVNSGCPAQPISGIDHVTFPEAARLAGVLRAAWATVPWDEI